MITIMVKAFNVAHFAHSFCMNHQELVTRPTIQLYLQILGIDWSGLNVEFSPESQQVLEKITERFLTYPKIAEVISEYLVTGVSKVDFALNLSPEQFRYVTSLDTADTKLIACAGSGKTRSVLARIKFMVEHGLVEKGNIYAITFSEAAALDFKTKIKHLFPNYEEFCYLSNLSTIDSMAKSVLCRVRAHKSDNVSILSAAFRNYLKEIQTGEELDRLRQIKDIKHLFVDEAQDLNQTQFEITKLLQTKCQTRIHLIGDPNQNIYQFRNSSSSYLINFPARQFDLTVNYRSTQEIIDFAGCFKQIPTKPSVSATERRGNPVVVMTKPSSYIHDLIIKFIRLYEKEEDLSEIALICPTRGTGTYSTVGLSVLFNLLRVHNIPVNQLYSETGPGDEKHKKSKKLPGHINLLTYHGTKGLEFKVVFVMDFYYHLFNIRPTDEEHENHRYLLYVASSRACDLMYVCTYTNTHDGYLNHWIARVPPTHYFTDTALRVPQLAFREKEERSVRGITELISTLPDTKLDQIHDFITISEDFATTTQRIYKDFTNIDRCGDEALFGIFVEELFYLQHHLSHNIPPRELGLIENILENKTVVIESEADYKTLRKFIKDNQLTWAQFDLNRSTISPRICQLIEANISRDCALESCILCNNEFIQIIQFNMDDIRNSYRRYLNPASYNHNYATILTDFFYLIVVQYAYDNNHYFYINNHGADKHRLLQNGAELFEAMNQYVSLAYTSCSLKLKEYVCYHNLGIQGEMDFIEVYDQPFDETIVEIKCVKDISFAFYIQLILYNFCYYYQNPNKANLFKNKFKILNLLTGLEHYLILSISPANMFNLLIILAEEGNLYFRDLNLVYDLETTQLIQTRGPFQYQPNRSFRTINQKRGPNYFTVTYPEIIEIAIRDYDTHMILINTLIKPQQHQPLEKVVTELTGIHQSMLLDKPTIQTIKCVLERKMKNFINPRLMAHNGSRFDNSLLTFDKLVDPSRVTFIDTQNLIPPHMPTKLESKNLAHIYFVLFGKDYKGHRALADVNALIKIMRHLRIRL